MLLGGRKLETQKFHLLAKPSKLILQALFEVRLENLGASSFSADDHVPISNSEFLWD
jgi:hypothetical protein